MRNERGLIPRLQKRYAKLLRWTLDHRGWSVTGIVLIIAISIVPMVLTKKNMFGGDEAARPTSTTSGGQLHQEQMSAEILRVEDFVNANRKRFHVARSIRGEASRATPAPAWPSTPRRPARPSHHRGDPQGIAEIRARGHRHRQRRRRAGRRQPGGQNVQVQLVGDSAWVLHAIGDDIVPILAHRKELRDVHVVPATRTPNSTCTSTANARRHSASARNRWRSSSTWRCAVRRCASSAAATKCRYGCASPARRITGSRTCPASRCVRPMAAACPCWRWWTCR